MNGGCNGVEKKKELYAVQKKYIIEGRRRRKQKVVSEFRLKEIKIKYLIVFKVFRLLFIQEVCDRDRVIHF